MSKQVQVTVEKPAPAVGEKKKPTNAERFPSAAKAEAEAKAKKEAAAKAKAEGKTVEKEKPVKAAQAPFVGRFAKKGSPVYLIAADARPGNGRLLFAHTHASLSLFGMLDAKLPPAPKSALVAFLGNTAVGYHLKEHNMVEGAKGVSLTAAGRNKFMNRLTEGKFDTKVAMAFQTLFIDGKVDPVTQINPKNIAPWLPASV